MRSPEEILAEALTLPPNQRADVAAQLIRSLEVSDADAGAPWDQELDHRLDALDAGQVELLTWDEVETEIEHRKRRGTPD